MIKKELATFTSKEHERFSKIIRDQNFDTVILNNENKTFFAINYDNTIALKITDVFSLLKILGK